jgi:DNA-binding NarL/FixJ family response regulator
MRMQGERNSYNGVLEDWKVNLILERARRRGIRPEELDDAQQEVALALIGFRYDLAKAGGAPEIAALRAVIDRQLAFIQRGRARAKKRQERYEMRLGIHNGASRSLPVQADETPAMSLSLDVQAVVETLSPKEKAVCAEFAKGESRETTARTLGLSRYEVEMLLRFIRARFQEAGVGA